MCRCFGGRGRGARRRHKFATAGAASGRRQPGNPRELGLQADAIQVVEADRLCLEAQVLTLVSFIDEHKEAYGVEPMCRVLPIAPSTHYEHARRRREPARCPARYKRDVELRAEIGRLYDENYLVYGASKVWRQLNLRHS
jgi:hypothetical protein